MILEIFLRIDCNHRRRSVTLDFKIPSLHLSQRNANGGIEQNGNVGNHCVYTDVLFNARIIDLCRKPCIVFADCKSSINKLALCKL